MQNRGFTLIELAVAIFIIALLVGALAVPLATMVENRQIAETEKTMREIREALLGFAAVNVRLPRPATSATDGTERIAACANDAECTGFLPWATLGLGNADGWGNLFRYSVAPAFANVTLTNFSATGNKIIQTRNSSPPYALTQYLPGIPSPPAPSIAAVVLSHGNKNWGTNASSGALRSDLSATNIDEDANISATATFIYRLRSDNPSATGGEFDDLMTHLSATDVFAITIKAGKLP